VLSRQKAGKAGLGFRVEDLSHLSDLAAVGVFGVRVIRAKSRLESDRHGPGVNELPVTLEDGIIVTKPGPEPGPVLVTNQIDKPTTKG